MDRKRRRQAEFLVYRLIPWTAITEIGVINRVMNGKVREYLSQAEYVSPVSIRRDWYY
ncbi:MAG: DUF4433 domain-containing protein [Armatimonadetes bacterium]|nr:DUF4433 domain-containing protein [Armatimonadota bacterium]